MRALDSADDEDEMTKQKLPKRFEALSKTGESYRKTKVGCSYHNIPLVSNSAGIDGSCSGLL